MKRIDVTKRPVDIKSMIKRRADENDAEIIIDEPCEIYDQNGVKLFHYDTFDTTGLLEQVLTKIRYDSSNRVSGITSTSRIFGFQPKNGLRAAPCSVARLAKEYPVEHKIVTEFCGRVEDVYKREFPELHSAHVEQVNKDILPAWRINGGVFTSGIINQNNPLNYHTDNNNYHNFRSCMINFRRGVMGGYLVIPEYNIKFKLLDNTLIIFDGATVLHGVSPIKLLDKDSHRFSIVFYSLDTMRPCKAPADELQDFKKKQTMQAMKRFFGKKDGK